ncbi:hypothetical protein EBB07_26455 [Paenibacillaceae bacterium]|nr:hypothetical protein EBB07_26455 [Paenibacillaceae bacterium]
MAFCIQFKLLEVEDTKARYIYGDCSENYEGRFELDLFKLSTNEALSETTMSEAVKLLKPCLSEGVSQYKANRAFSKIYKHYIQTGSYLEEGGYYA